MRNKCRNNFLKRNIKLKCYLVLLAILALITLLACQQTDAVQEKMNLATQYMSEGNYEQAIVMYREVLDAEPENVEAYLGIADAYEAMEDYETGLAVLEEAYEVTGEETIVQEIESVEELQAQQEEQEKVASENVSEIAEEPELVPVIPECIVDGVKHPAYYEYDFSDEQKAYLDQLISLTESGRYFDAIAALDQKMINSFSQIEENVNSSIFYQDQINCVYNDRKIFLVGDFSKKMFVIIPMNDGMGYVIQTGGDIFNSYLVGSCSNGFFNGEFSGKVEKDRDGDIRYYDVKGTFVNNLLDGEYSTYDSKYDLTEIELFNMGKLVYWNMKETETGVSVFRMKTITHYDGAVYENEFYYDGLTVEQTIEWLEGSPYMVDYAAASFFYSLETDDATSWCW